MVVGRQAAVERFAIQRDSTFLAHPFFRFALREFDDVGTSPPINLETLAGSSPVSGTQYTRLVHVEGNVDWELAGTWVDGKSHGILNAVVKPNQHYPTPYFAILNEGSLVNRGLAAIL